jgi:hypothetical protein
MNSALEFHDSEVRTVVGASGSLQVVFSSAYVHKSEGQPGINDGAGYTQPAELVFSEATWEGVSPLCSGRISDGLLVVNGSSMSLVPLPFSASGKVSAEFVFTSGARLTVSASSASCVVSGEPHFVENYVAG